MNFDSTVTEKFLRYIKINTKSDEELGTHPSSKCQFDLARLLKQEIEAMDIAVKAATAKFDESVELHVKLGVDSKHADQQVRGVVVLPNGTGKSVKVLVIAKGEKADEALAAGADIVGAEEIIAKIQKDNWFDFDVCITTPDMMGMVGRIAR